MIIGALALSPVASAQDGTPSHQTVLNALQTGSVEGRVEAACRLAHQDFPSPDYEKAVDVLLTLIGDASTAPADTCDDLRDWGRWYTEGKREALTVGREAIRALARIADDSGIDVAARVMPFLADDSDFARANAAWAMGAMDHEPAVRPLGRLVASDSNPDAREQAAWALGAIGRAAATDDLLSALSDDVPDVRERVAWALGAIGSRTAVDGLIASLDDSHANVRERAAWALGAIGHPKAEDALLELLKDDDPDVRRTAAWALTAVL